MSTVVGYFGSSPTLLYTQTPVGPGTSMALGNPYYMTWRSGQLYIADSTQRRILAWDPTTGNASTAFNLNFTSGPSGSGFVLFDNSAANMYLGLGGIQIHKVAPPYDLSTRIRLAGQTSTGSLGEDGPADAAYVNVGGFAAVDAYGAVYVPDHTSNAVRKIWLRTA
jgi:hypothetical protein